jgi:hypothetical protein
VSVQVKSSGGRPLETEEVEVKIMSNLRQERFIQKACLQVPSDGSKTNLYKFTVLKGYHPLQFCQVADTGWHGSNFQVFIKELRGLFEKPA